MSVEHVVIYAQGTHRFVQGLTIDRLAQGLSLAMGDGYRPSARIEDFNFEGTSITCRTIDKSNGAKRSANVKILEADYYDIFLELESIGLPARVSRTVGTVIRNIGLAVKPFSRGWQGDRRAVSKLQRRYVTLLVLINLLIPLGLLVGLVLFSLQVGEQFQATLNAVSSIGTEIEKESAKPGAVPLIAGALIGLTALIAFLNLIWKNLAPPNLVGVVSMFVRDPVCMLMYFVNRPVAGPIRGRMVRRLDRVYRLARETYPGAQIHVFAYSFGAVIAYDWLFPLKSQGPVYGKREIGALVTLGLPYEMVATFWPGYFNQGRDFDLTRLRRFQTVSLAGDVVGSALSSDAVLRQRAKSEDSEFQLAENNAEELSDGWKAGLSKGETLRGVEMHGLYFGMADKLDSPAFRHCADSIKAVTDS